MPFLDEIHSGDMQVCIFKWDKVFKNGPSKICERQLLKNLKEYDLPKQTTHQIF